MDRRVVYGDGAMFGFEEGCGGSTLPAFNRENSPLQEVSLALSLLEPLQSSVPHHHLRTEEVYIFVQGSGVASVGGRSVEVRPGIAIAIAVGVVHVVENTSSDTTLMYWAVSVPPYEADDMHRESD